MESPKIGERVKFWQEQDRINRELIPRVIKSHELLTRHVENHPDFVSAMAQIQAVEASVEELSVATKAQIASVEAGVEELSNATKTQIQAVEASVEELSVATKAQIASVEAEVEELSNTTKTQFQKIRAKIESVSATIQGQIEAVKTRTAELECSLPGPVARLAPYAALAMSVVALIVAVVN